MKEACSEFYQILSMKNESGFELKTKNKKQNQTTNSGALAKEKAYLWDKLVSGEGV